MQVLPDGERTMRTCLSAALEMQAECLPSNWLDSARALHLEGYALYKPQLTKAAIAQARARGAMVFPDAFSAVGFMFCLASQQVCK